MFYGSAVVIKGSKREHIGIDVKQPIKLARPVFDRFLENTSHLALRVEKYASVENGVRASGGRLDCLRGTLQELSPFCQ